MSGRSDLVAVVGNPRASSRTAALAAQLLVALGADPPTVVDLGGLLPERGAPLGTGAVARYQDALDALHAARVAVVATPIYKGSYSGLLKSFLDLVATGALRGVVAIPVITVGSPAHALAADVHLRPLLVELGASTPTASLVVEERFLADPGPVIGSWLETAGPVLARSTPLRIPGPAGPAADLDRVPEGVGG